MTRFCCTVNGLGTSKQTTHDATKRVDFKCLLVNGKFIYLWIKISSCSPRKILLQQASHTGIPGMKPSCREIFLFFVCLFILHCYGSLLTVWASHIKTQTFNFIWKSWDLEVGQCGSGHLEPINSGAHAFQFIRLFCLFNLWFPVHFREEVLATYGRSAPWYLPPCIEQEAEEYLFSNSSTS